MDKNNQNFISHLTELRNRVIFSLVFFLLIFAFCYNFINEIYQILLYPLDIALDKSFERKVIFTGLAEAFMTYIKLAFLTSLFISIPFFLIQLYIFLAPGLFKNEKRFIKYIFLFSPILFYGGGYMVYQYIFPLAWKFFLSFETIQSDTLPILLEARISEYLSITASLIIVFGLAAQIPLVILLLITSGAISYESLSTKRKYVIIILLILAAIITPPDLISQIGLAIPTYLLFELSLLICKSSKKKEHA